jgi:5-hydroxyisourate hydrolase-like protein (transthyretin family)
MTIYRRFFLGILLHIAFFGSLVTADAATIKGTVKLQGKPYPSVEVYATRLSSDTSSKPNSVKTDSDGAFVLTDLPPGIYSVGYMKEYYLGTAKAFTLGMTTTQIVQVDLKEGETRTIQIGGTGRTIRGKMVMPEGVTADVAWRGGNERTLELRFTEGERKSAEFIRMHRRRIRVDVEKDGSFSAVDVPPGKYTLTISVGDNTSAQPDSEQIGYLKREVDVPDTSSTAPIELGAVTIKMLSPGDPKPFP